MQKVVPRMLRDLSIPLIHIAELMKQMGADCLILGGTEVGLRFNPDNVPLLVFATPQIHCEAAMVAAFNVGPDVFDND
ncbi:MAG: hypothetical protein ACSHX3_00155 [Litorimonas sp.]